MSGGPATGSAVRAFARRWPRATNFVAGVVIAAVCGVLSVLWHNGLFGLQYTSDTRPLWLRVIVFILTWLPLGVLSLLVVLWIRPGSSARPIAFAAGTITPYLLLVGYLFVGPGIEEWSHRRHFEPAAWRQDDSTDPMWPARLAMVDDLLEGQHFNGKPRALVDSLLGPGDSTEYYREWDIVYWLGPERGMLRIDSEWLVFRVGPDGRITDHRIVRD